MNDKRMTREQAIEIFKKQQSLCFRENDWYKALTMAINALQTEPCEEAISKQAAIDAIHYYCKNICGLSDYNLCQDCPSERFVGLLKELPSVQPEPKMGRWILFDECSNSGYYCSECHKKVVKEGWSNTVKKIKYCPNCGCQMKSEGKE